MAGRKPDLNRGTSHPIRLQSRRVVYAENGMRSVPLEETLRNIETFFLSTGAEVQFKALEGSAGNAPRSLLECLSPQQEDTQYFGKGLSRSQALASACMEFIERLCARQRAGDVLQEDNCGSSETEACRDPRLFILDPDKGYHPDKRIDWTRGYSLTHHEPVRIPANLVFYPYNPDRTDKVVAWTDSNGLASGNNLEEAILHGLLEVIERDAAMISEYNSLPLTDIRAENPPAEVGRLIASLEEQDIHISFKKAMTDLPFPVVAAFLCHKNDRTLCSVAFGCHLDAGLALSRALTEAIQLLPPSVHHQEWLLSGSPDRYRMRSAAPISLEEMPGLASADLKENIGTCLNILSEAGSEVILADLSLPDLPFRVVRVLATQLQPLIHDRDRRLSRRFFQVPVRLRHRTRPALSTNIRFWPLVGYR